MAPVRGNAFRSGRYDLSGLDVPLKDRADRVQGAAFGGKNDRSVTQPAHTQGPEAERIPNGRQLPRGGDQQAVGADHPLHGS